MRVTVYLGASEGTDPSIRRAAEALGQWIGASGHSLVYGGSSIGLMGILAESVLKAGGRVIGVEPRRFVEAELQHPGITELIVTEDFFERKRRMIELGDAFIAFPGGTGTLDELSDVMCMLSLGDLDRPCVIYDLGGYYSGLRAQIGMMLAKGFTAPERLRHVRFAESLQEIAAILSETGSA